MLKKKKKTINKHCDPAFIKTGIFKMTRWDAYRSDVLCQVSDLVKRHLEIPQETQQCEVNTKPIKMKCIIFVVSVKSMSEVYRTCTGVIMPITAGGHASLTVTALRLSVMQMYTRVGTVKAAVALMRPR